MHSATTKPPIRWLNLIVLGVPPIVAATLVPWYGFTHGYDGFEWAWFFALLTFCEMSITAGYHRLWSHKSYKAHPILRFIFALGGAMALQNNCITWASDHRRHHLHVDDNDKDPYSARRGFWYSHFGWMIREWHPTQPDNSNVKDLEKDPILVWQRKHYVPLTLFMNIGVPVLIGWWHGDILASLLLLGFLRLVLSQHFTYLINSAAHIWGKKNYSPDQTAADNWFIALFTYGEGYHNYHHTFAWDYRNGIKWYHYDPTKWLIKACSWLGLTRDLRSCSAYRLEKTRLEVQFKRALVKCENLRDPAPWRHLLEEEYQQFVNTLNRWYETKQQWYQAKSQQLSDQSHKLSRDLHDRSHQLSKGLHDRLHELDPQHLKARYQELKAQVREQRKSWKSLQARFALYYNYSAT